MRSLHEAIDDIAQGGKRVTRKTIDKLLRTCIKQKDVAAAKRVHTLMVSSHHVESAFVDQLIRFFLSNACLPEANAAFDSIPSPAVHTWHAIISAHSEGGEKVQALNLYHQMQGQALVMPNAYIFSCVLKACSGLGDLLEGALIHSDAVIMSLESDKVVGTALVDLYCKCKRMNEAFSVFENIKSRNVISWNALLTGYVQNQQWVPTISLFDRLQKEGVKPDRVTFLCIMKACSSLGFFEGCKLLYAQIEESGLVSDVVIGNALIDMFAKSGELQQANEILKILQIRDVVSWTSIIAGFVQHGHGFAALETFDKMHREGIRPEKVTILCVLRACGILGACIYGRLVHDQLIRHGPLLDATLGNTLMDMYAKCGSLKEAQKILEVLPYRTVVAWNVILLGYSQQGLDHLALDVFEKMQQERVKPTEVTFLCMFNVCGRMGAVRIGEILHDRAIREQLEQVNVIGNTIIDMYGKCGRLDSACKALSQLSSANVVSWGALIAGYTQQENCFSALLCFQKMLEQEVEPDLVILLSVLKACGGMGVLKWGRLLYHYVIRKALESDLGVGNTLIDMYARCGSLVEAEVIFNRSSNQNNVSWNAMIAGHAQHGFFEQAVQWFKNMQSLCIKPTSQTFVSVLGACTHGGKVKHGYRYLMSMLTDHGFSPGIEHFNCMIDLLGRTGHIRDAEGLLNTMPALPNINGWMSLLTSCLLFGNVIVGRRSFEEVVKLDPDTSAGHILMLNIYADAQMWDDVFRLCTKWRSQGTRRKPGQAYLEVDGHLSKFVVGDLTQFEGKDMSFKIRNLHSLLRGGGYVPHSEIIFEFTFARVVKKCYIPQKEHEYTTVH